MVGKNCLKFFPVNLIGEWVANVSILTERPVAASTIVPSLRLSIFHLHCDFDSRQ